MSVCILNSVSLRLKPAGASQPAQQVISAIAEEGVSPAFHQPTLPNGIACTDALLLEGNSVIARTCHGRSWPYFPSGITAHDDPCKGVQDGERLASHAISRFQQIQRRSPL